MADAAELAALSKAVKSKVKQRARQPLPAKSTGTGVIYIGHLPHGFYEDAMQGFFSQFGNVLAVKVSRSKRTGRSRGYAFVKFEHQEVADIVASTMNGYFMCDKYLVCHTVEADKLHPRTFVAHKKKVKATDPMKKAIAVVNAPRSAEAKGKALAKQLANERKRADKLAALGYEFGGYAAAVETAGAGKKRARGSQGDAVAAADTPTKRNPTTPAKQKTPAKEGKKGAKSPAAAATPAPKSAKKQAKSPAPAAAPAAAATPAPKSAKKQAKTPAPATPEAAVVDAFSPPKTRSRGKKGAKTPGAATPAPKSTKKAAKTPAPATPEAAVVDAFSPPKTRSRAKKSAATPKSARK